MHNICNMCVEVIPYNQCSVNLICCDIHAHINCFNSYVKVFKNKNANGWLCPRCNHLTYFSLTDNTFNEMLSIKMPILYTIYEE